MNIHSTTPHKLRLLRVRFDAELAAHELPAFRGAVAQKAGLEHSLFHNHTGQGFHYRYPLIQYKRLGGNPLIVCLGEGVDAVHHFFQQRDWSLQLGRRTLEMKIQSLDLQTYTMQVWDRPMAYRLQDWIALDQASYADYQRETSLAGKLHLLQTKLTGNLISLAKGIGWTLPPREERPVQCQITELGQVRTVTVKGVKVLGFNLQFTTNLFLPNDLGLGKSASLGHGVVRQQRVKSEEMDNPRDQRAKRKTQLQPNKISP
jgi:hypothetical protein